MKFIAVRDHPTYMSRRRDLKLEPKLVKQTNPALLSAAAGAIKVFGEVFYMKFYDNV